MTFDDIRHQFEAEFEIEEELFGRLVIVYSYYPGWRGIWNGPPDAWAPGEPDDMEYRVFALRADNAYLDLTDFLTSQTFEWIEDLIEEDYLERHGQKGGDQREGQEREER